MICNCISFLFCSINIQQLEEKMHIVSLSNLIYLTFLCRFWNAIFHQLKFLDVGKTLHISGSAVLDPLQRLWSITLQHAVISSQIVSGSEMILWWKLFYCSVLFVDIVTFEIFSVHKVGTVCTSAPSGQVCVIYQNGRQIIPSHWKKKQSKTENICLAL